MEKQDSCKGCVDKDRCEEAYRRLDQIKGPSVVLNVVVAFLLPILVFIGVLAGSERILADRIQTEGIRTLISFLLALLTTAGVVVAVKAARRKLARKR